MRFLRRRRTGGLELALDGTEAAVLAQLVEQLVGLLSGEDDAPTDPLSALVGLSGGDGARPVDPALARLLPDAYRDGAAGVSDAAAASQEFRRLTESDLRAGRRAAATTVLASLAQVGDAGGRIVLDAEQADAWLGCLNDFRLVLGTRLEVTPQTYAEIDRLAPDDPRRPALHLFAFLGWAQESLLRRLDRGR